MPSLTSTSSSIRAVFALDVVVAALAFVLTCTAILLALTSRKSRNNQYQGLSSSAPLKSTLATHAFLIPSLFFLCLEYAILAATVVLQLHQSSAITITTAYDYQALSQTTQSTNTSHGLSFTQQFAAILFTTCLNGAVWLHSSHVTSNGTGIGQPSKKSKVWNTFILLCIIGTGLAAWGQALSLGDNGRVTYAGAVRRDEVTRALHITFRVIVIFTSLSVAVEVVRKWTDLNRNGMPGNPERPILQRFTFLVVPLIVFRDVFIIVDIVMIYVSYSSWSGTTQRAIAFLLIVFGQFTNLGILTMVTWGAWSMGRMAGRKGGVGESKG